MAKDSRRKINHEIRDYTCNVLGRQRVNGELLPQEAILAKVRHEQQENGEVVTPHSIYLKFVRPKASRGREVLYVAGENDGKMLVRKGGSMLAFLTAFYDPHGELAMSGTRYPLTDFGIQTMVQRMIEIGEQEMRHEECKVTINNNVVLKGHHCTRVEILHPIRRDHFRYHLVRVHVNDELNVPFRFEAYDWPESPGGEPVLLEEFTYYNLKTNVGLTDADFDRNNPEYAFGGSKTAAVQPTK